MARCGQLDVAFAERDDVSGDEDVRGVAIDPHALVDVAAGGGGWAVVRVDVAVENLGSGAAGDVHAVSAAGADLVFP